MCSQNGAKTLRIVGAGAETASKIAFVKETCRAAFQGEENPYPGPADSEMSTFFVRGRNVCGPENQLFRFSANSRAGPGRAGLEIF